MRLQNFFSTRTEYVKVEDKNRFYYMLQQMQANRWKITAIVLGLFTLIIVGINAGVFMGATIGEDWKEMLLILLGAFVGNLNKVIDYWFNSEDRDKMLIQKVDEEDGLALSNVAEYPDSPKESTPNPDYTQKKSEVVTKSEPVSQEVVASAFLLPDVVTLEIVSRNSTGTVGMIKGISSAGVEVLLRGETFRSRTQLPSAWFNLI